MIRCFELSSDQISVRNILANKNFLEIEIYSISNANPNRNQSCFTLESMRKGIETYTDKPILGFFNQGDFESHKGQVGYDPELDKDYWDNSNGEQILGFVRQSDHKEIVEKGGLMWIVCTAMICTQYNYKQVKRLLRDKKKKVSVEISVKDSEVIDGIEYIYDFELLGITILGSKNGMPVREGIEGAHLSVLDLLEERYSEQKKALVFAYSQLDNENYKEDKDLANEEGKTEALKVNKSKEAMSDTAWGDVDKTELRHRVVEASNFKQIADDVFLDLREGWEEGEVSKLKYPVMEIKGDELVYNRGALGSAKAYAEKNNEEAVLKKLKAIYEHLDLKFEAEEKYACEDFCDLYEDDECDCSKDGENHPDGEVRHEEMQTECDELRMKCQAAEERCKELEAKCGEYELKCAEYEQKCSEYEECIEKYKDEMKSCEEKVADYETIKCELDGAREKLCQIRVGEQKEYIENVMCKMNLDKEDVKPIVERCERNEYSAIEDIDKDLAYIDFQKKKSSLMSETKTFEVAIPPVREEIKNDRKNKSISERLKDNIKK